VAREIKFSTFLKLLGQVELEKSRGELQKYTRGGGFPYWQPLEEAAPQTMKAGADIEHLKSRIASRSTGHRRIYNTRAVERLHSWAQARACIVVEDLEEIVEPIGSSSLAVRLKPDVVFEQGGRRRALSVWATNKPLLSNDTLSIGLFFQRQAYRSHGERDAEFLIFDSIQNRMFSDLDIVAHAATKLTERVQIIARQWASIESGTPVTKEDRPGAPRT